MKTNCSAREQKKYDKDPIFDAVVRRMTEKGKGFFIISCGPWIHPLNTVLNCYSIMFDGFSQYKFELMADEKGKIKYKVAEIRSIVWLTLPLMLGDRFTQEELVELISKSH